MTYAKGSSISAADFNSFAGLTSTAAGSGAAAQYKAGYLYGVGYGDRGYGQTTPTLSAKVAGNPIGQEWQNLRTILSTLASWQNTSATLLPPSSSFNTNSSVQAHERDAPSLNSYDIQDLLVTLDVNRFNYNIVNMLLVNNVVSSTRATTWGAGTSGITAEFSVTFADENAARYFFNTGSEIRINLNHPSTLTSRDTSWNTVLNNLSVAFRANSSSRISGSYGTAQNIGYYNLTTSYQVILDGTNSGIGAYTTNDFTVEAKALSITGLNGAKGSVVYFRITLLDSQTNAFSDIVQSGTNASLSFIRPSSVLSGIASPTTGVVTSF